MNEEIIQNDDIPIGSGRPVCPHCFKPQVTALPYCPYCDTVTQPGRTQTTQKLGQELQLNIGKDPLVIVLLRMVKIIAYIIAAPFLLMTFFVMLEISFFIDIIKALLELIDKLILKIKRLLGKTA